MNDLLYNLGSDHIENTVLPSSDPAVPLLLHVHLLPLKGVYFVVA
jgi:hypothetical protein